MHDLNGGGFSYVASMIVHDLGQSMTSRLGISKSRVTMSVLEYFL